MDTHPEKRQYIYRPLWLRRLPGFTIALTCAVCRQPHRLHTHTHAPSFFAGEVSGMDIRIPVSLSGGGRLQTFVCPRAVGGVFSSWGVFVSVVQSVHLPTHRSFWVAGNKTGPAGGFHTVQCHGDAIN